MFLFLSCRNIEWEYKVIKVLPDNTPAREGSEAFNTSFVMPSDTELNKLGKEGWELVSAESELETAFPNFGKAEYVTGLKPNVRPAGVILIFKRMRRHG